jgi:hypothetical protein
VNISALDSVLLKSQMMLTASRGHESAIACETEEDRFIWTSGGSAEFDAASFACGKKRRMMRPVPQAAGTLKLYNNFADKEDDLPLPPGQLDHGDHHVRPKTKRQPSPCAVLEFGS